MTGEEAKKRLSTRYKKQNEYIKNTYDRLSVTVPKGTKDRIKDTGFSMNEFINVAILKYLEEVENN